jgi:MFS family permease
MPHLNSRTALVVSNVFGSFVDNVYRMSLGFFLVMAPYTKDSAADGMPLVWSAVVLAGIPLIYALVVPLAGRCADRYDRGTMLRWLRFAGLIAAAAAVAGFTTRDGLLCAAGALAMWTVASAASPLKSALAADLFPGREAPFGALSFLLPLLAALAGTALLVNSLLGTGWHGYAQSGAHILAGAVVLASVASWLASLRVVTSGSAAPKLPILTDPRPAVAQFFRDQAPATTANGGSAAWTLSWLLFGFSFVALPPPGYATNFELFAIVFSLAAMAGAIVAIGPVAAGRSRETWIVATLAGCLGMFGYGALFVGRFHDSAMGLLVLGSQVGLMGAGCGMGIVAAWTIAARSVALDIRGRVLGWDAIRSGARCSRDTFG